MKSAADVIRFFEGLSLEAYRCPAGVLTIGYGHTQGVRKGARITEAEAERLLAADIAVVRGSIRQYGLPLRPNQEEALVSFVYNIGVGKFAGSTLLKRLKTDGVDSPHIRGELQRWNQGGGRVLAGLVKRRDAEAALYDRE